MYYMFGFIFLAFLILSVTCCETAILLCYFHLCSEVGGAWLNKRGDVNIYCRIIDGGGGHSLAVDQQHFIYSYLQYIISTTSLALRVWHHVSSTLAIPSSWYCCSSY